MQKLPLAEGMSSDSMFKCHGRRGIVYITKKLMTKETGLYKGLSINLFRAVPDSAVTMLTSVYLVCYLLFTESSLVSAPQGEGE